jgi:hypothetical protein
MNMEILMKVMVSARNVHVAIDEILNVSKPYTGFEWFHLKARVEFTEILRDISHAVESHINEATLM